ncbi:MAG: peptidoglycan binding domain-containing protein, partial [Caldilineaceae bacterium]
MTPRQNHRPADPARSAPPRAQETLRAAPKQRTVLPQYELQPARAPTPQTRPRGSGGFWGSLLWVMLGMIGGVLLLAGYLYFSDFLAPGVRVLGTDIGAVSTQRAADRLVEAWQQRTVRLEAPTGQIDVAPVTLGIAFDAAATVKTIHAQNRTWTGIQRLIRGGNITMSPMLRLDRESAAAALRNLTPELETAAVDASIEIIDGRAVITEPRTGRAVDIV